MPTYHPRLNDHGNAVVLHHPTQPTSIQSWTMPGAIATIIPDGVLPAELNGIALAAWVDVPVTSDAWEGVGGQYIFDEPSFNKPLGKKAAAGVVIQEADGRIWIVSPSNGFGGYSTTFPKGRGDGPVSLQATAIREAYEESGLKVAITGFLLDSERTQTYTRYYLARRVGGSPAAMGWETQAVHLVPRSDLMDFLTHKNDKPLLAAIFALPSSVDNHQFVVTGGGNLVRMREAIRSFREQFGSWPTGLALGSETLASIQTHLTPLGFAMLLARLSIAAQIKHDLILAYDDCRNQLDYASDGVWHARTIETEVVDRWIWGCSLQ